MPSSFLHCIIFLSFLYFTNTQTTSITGSFLEIDGNQIELTKLSKQHGRDTIIIQGVGEMFAKKNPVTNRCENASWSIQPTVKTDLVELLSLAHELGMETYIGLLDIDHNKNATYEWDSVCMDTYINMQITAAIQLAKIFDSYSFSYHWYVPQETDLDVLPPSNPGCAQDGETNYLIGLTNDLKTVRPNKNILISPYYPGQQSPNYIANVVSTLLACAPAITFCAPQDGCGSFGFPTNFTRLYFEHMGTDKDISPRLWANVETFMPKAKICEDAPQARIDEQIQSVSSYVKKIINWWAYNLPGAPPCSSIRQMKNFINYN